MNMSEQNTRLIYIYTDRRLSPCATFFYPASKLRGSHDGDVCAAKYGLSPAAHAVSDTCSRPVLFQFHTLCARSRAHETRYLRDSLAPYPQRFSSFFLSLPFYFGIRLSDPSVSHRGFLVFRVSAGLDLAIVLSRTTYADN